MDLEDAYDFQPDQWDSMREANEEFEWTLPDTFNAGRFLADRWAAKPETRTALYYEDETAGESGELTFEDLSHRSNQLANYFESVGMVPGDRIALNVPNKRQILLSYLAAWKVGAVPVPMSTRYGPDALSYRLGDSGARLAVVDECNIEEFREARAEGTDIELTLTVGDVTPGGNEREFRGCIDGQSTEHEPLETDIEAPALLPYTSGTTGDPKGVLLANRSFIGQMPGVQFHMFNLDVRPGDVYWGPGEFTWAGVITLMVAAWWNGIGLVLRETGEAFDPEGAFRTMERFGVTHSFLPATSLRMMSKVSDPARRYDLEQVRLIASGGEALGVESAEWVENVFDATIHEGYAQTELWNLVVGDCTALDPFKPGWMGCPLPGHDATVVDPETRDPVPDGEVGELAFDRDDPVVFLEYWNDPEKTESKFYDDLVLTEDLVVREDGQFKFVSRADDVIISSGYRIGPDEVEDSLVGHDAVVDAGVIGVPDDERGTVVKAFVTIEDGYDAADDLVADIKSHVKERLADYEYPRQIEVVDQLPRTTTGKVRRNALRDEEQAQ